MSANPIPPGANDQFRAAFREEALDLLRQLEALLLGLHEENTDAEHVGSIFRMLHTIKGSGAMFGFTILAAFTHHLENAFDCVRCGKIPVSRALIDIALECSDVMRGLVINNDAGDMEPRLSLGQRVTQIVASASPEGITALPEAEIVPAQEPAETRAMRLWRIHFAPGPDMMRFGADPLLLVRELGRMGALQSTMDLAKLPVLDEIDPTCCYASWDLTVETDADLVHLRDVFLFVEDTCELSIEHEPSPASPQSPHQSVASALLAPAGGSLEPANISTNKDAASEARTARGGRLEHGVPENSGAIRVATTKLDQLVNLVGELVTVQARLSELALRNDDVDISAVAEEIERLSAALRESSMSARMMPIRDTFERFRRLVYDLARDLSKSARLSMEGCETELDKTVLDQLGDPLLHLIRNSMDHGLEQQEERLRVGKPAQGNLHLNARYSGASVLITVSDDGRGIDAARVRERAVERGMISADASMTESEIFNLIFEPGFSTAKEVTDLSGRGVGLDVVRRNIESLRGSIEIASTLGQGTAITLRIPLTLAIIDGLLVAVGEQYFVLPLANALECIEISRDAIDNANGKHLVNVRGDVVAYVRLREYFGISAALPEFEQVMLVSTEAGRYGLVVDRVLGDCQTMVKSLGRMYRQVNELSGATVLGNGSVALILDPHRLVQECIKGALTPLRASARSPGRPQSEPRSGPERRSADNSSPKIVPISQKPASEGAPGVRHE